MILHCFTKLICVGFCLNMLVCHLCLFLQSLCQGCLRMCGLSAPLMSYTSEKTTISWSLLQTLNILLLFLIQFLILDTDLSFSSHVKAVTKSAYYHLKNIARIRCFVSSQDLEKLVHAFITSRVDYCNDLLTGLPKKTIRLLEDLDFL